MEPTDLGSFARSADPGDLAQGRVWAGADAHRLGLVDELGSFNDMATTASLLSGIGGELEGAVEPWVRAFLDASVLLR